jgi:predicted permease
MDFSLIIFRQTILMSLYMLIGYALFRGKKIDAQGSRAIASVLVWAVIPSTIVKSCLIAYTPQRLYQMGESFLLGAVTLVIAMAVARICFGKDQVGQFAASFSNAGFIGIPLVQASLGDDAVFYIIGLIILLNLLQWTYGTSLLKGEKMQFSFKSILLTPITIAAIVGVAIFASGMGDALPSLCTNLISGVAALNAPLAMIVLGVYLAQTELKHLVSSPRLYWNSAVRLLLIPCLTIPALALLPGDSGVKMAVFIAAAAPAGANAAVYSQLYNRDYTYACALVTQSTILSVVTLPLMTALAGLVIH